MPVIVSPVNARTLGDLKTRIADELARADLAPQIALAISDAIEEACTHRFWFMEVEDLPLPIVAGTPTYQSDDISAFIEIDQMSTGDGIYDPTTAAADAALVAASGYDETGTPTSFSRYDDTITFYPVPDRSATIYLSGLSHGGVLNDDTDSNVWTTYGERYIRALAKRDLLGHVIKDMNAAQAQDAFAKSYREELQKQTHYRSATGEMACNG